jgi:hypothetical protein
MKATRLDERRPQLKRGSQPDVRSPEPDDSSQSGIREMVSPETLERELAKPSNAVTVVFRGVLPMERLVHMIRRRAAESAPSTPLCVEVEQHADAQRWRVRVHSPTGELSALEAGPFLAVTRAFALLQQAS